MTIKKYILIFRCLNFIQIINSRNNTELTISNTKSWHKKLCTIMGMCWTERKDSRKFQWKGKTNTTQHLVSTGKFHSTSFSHSSLKYPYIILEAMHIETFTLPPLPNNLEDMLTSITYSFHYFFGYKTSKMW